MFHTNLATRVNTLVYSKFIEKSSSVRFICTSTHLSHWPTGCDNRWHILRARLPPRTRTHAYSHVMYIQSVINARVGGDWVSAGVPGTLVDCGGVLTRLRRSGGAVMRLRGAPKWSQEGGRSVASIGHYCVVTSLIK